MNVPSQQPSYVKTEPDVLQLNMESISKELNELIVTCEQEFGANQQQQQPSNITDKPKQMPMQPQNNYRDSFYLLNNLYGQPQPGNKFGFQNIRPNLKHCPNFSVAQLGFGFSVGNNYNSSIACYTSPNYLCSAAAATNVGHPILGSTPAMRNANVAPTYEFHYLKSPGNYQTKSGFRYNTIMSNGMYRKTPKLMNKYGNQKTPATSSENENLKMDLSKLNLFKESLVKNKVQHLFHLLRDLHRALAEEPPKFESSTNSQYEDTFTPLQSTKALMSLTLNVQNQVKQACRKLAIFYCEMQRIVNANKVYDPNMYAECEYYLHGFHQNIIQLEMYKRIEMEHQRGQFIREDVKDHAERLSLLLETINRQVREVRLRIYAFDWFMSVKYRGEVCLALQNENINFNKENVQSPKVGVVNKILQLCNETNKNSTSITTTTATTTNAISTKTTVAAIMKPDVPLNSGNSRMTSRVNVVTVNTLLNKNNEISMDQLKTKAVNNKRHPIFYIG